MLPTAGGYISIYKNWELKKLPIDGYLKDALQQDT